MSTRNRHSKNVRRAWHWTHVRKRVYRTHWEARRAILRLWWRERRADSLVAYECRWTDDFTAGRHGGELHYHIGHTRFGNIFERIRRRARSWYRHKLKYPLLRLRSRWRNWRHAGWHRSRMSRMRAGHDPGL